jgi:hypothetical protein
VVNTLRYQIAFLRHPLSSGFALKRENFAFNKIINPSWRRKIGIRNVESPPQTGAIVSLCFTLAGETSHQLSPDRPAVSSARTPTPSAYLLPARRTSFPHKKKNIILNIHHTSVFLSESQNSRNTKRHSPLAKDFCPLSRIRVV